MRLGRKPPLSTLDDEELRRLDPLKLRDRLLAEAADCFAGERVEEGVAALRRLSLATVDERTLAGSDPFLRAIAGDRTIIATTDLARRPAENEVVVVYGNFPHSFDNVVVNNPVRRHVLDFGELPFDVVESDPRWSEVARIVVINADDRLDRFDAVMRELATARAPLDRVVRQPGVFERVMDDPLLDGAIGCLKGHLAALRLAAPRPGEHALVLEDDFCFTSDIDTHLTDLSSFVERGYDYAVCLLATSKYGRIEQRDDLVSESRQPCTNAAGYLVSGDHYNRLVAVQEEALARLVATRDPNRYAADRYWSVLQAEGRFLVFRRKMGFQAASFSDIERRVARYLD
jgi:GR25 family glycosyltransferase involved in LPS biosynthesis